MDQKQINILVCDDDKEIAGETKAIGFLRLMTGFRLWKSRERKRFT